MQKYSYDTIPASKEMIVEIHLLNSVFKSDDLLGCACIFFVGVLWSAQ